MNLSKFTFQFGVFFVLLFFMSSCVKRSYQTISDGVIISPKISKTNEAKTVSIRFVSDEIVRISASPKAAIPDRESLIIVEQEKQKVETSIEQFDDMLHIKTEAIEVVASLITGEVQFYNLEGNSLLQENRGAYKKFSPINADGFTGYTLEQKFESPADEAFYGLGQHQSDEWNYKGKNEELYQYNTKVSVPFIVSNKNYGLLWDNYSYSRFGNPEEYGQMSQFKLFNKDGVEGGLTATYTTETGEIFTCRDESEIDYEHLESIKNFPEEFPFNNSSIVWNGEIEAPESGLYHFKLYYAGYTKVFVDGVEVVGERWRTAWNPNVYKFTVALNKGERMPLTLDWKPDGGLSYIGLKAYTPRTEQEQEKFAMWSEMGQSLDYYFIHGDNMDEIIKGYRQLTGKAAILPRWAYGFWQSRERYKTQDEIVNTLAEFRQRNIPIDNIVQDWSYWEEDQWGSHEFDVKRFPDPQQMMDDIHKMNARCMISVWPKFYENTDNYKALNKKGYIYQTAINDSIRDWISQGYIGSFYDPYSQDAKDIFWNQMKENIYQYGMDAWWMDASEPDIQSNASIEYRKELCGRTALGSSTEYFNTYSLANADAIYNGQRSVDPNKRVFLLTRSGFAGLQRYATATWSGDIGTRWEDMKAQITAGMNFSLSGIPYWTMDIGGFCVEKRYEKALEGSEDLEEWRELNTRWYQFGAFVPLFRAHGQFPYREVFHIAPENHEAYKSIVAYNKLRYRLMPYIYALAGEIYHNDYTLMRALVMDFADDKKVENIDDQYMFGPSLMICPVYRYKARSRSVYLPFGTKWYNAHDGTVLQGGQTIQAEAPYDQTPIFIKAGSIIPVGPEVQYTDEKLDAPIKIVVYKGANGSFDLYEDEGLNYNYENGHYSMIPISWSEKDAILTIGNRNGSFNGMQQNRTFEIVIVSESSIVDLNFDKLQGKTVQYAGEQIGIKL